MIRRRLLPALWLLCALQALNSALVAAAAATTLGDGSSSAPAEVAAGGSEPSVIGPTCASVHCGQGLQCLMEGGRPVCRCTEICPANYQPVCGSDSRTYGNECQLGSVACREHRRITVAAQGACPTPVTQPPPPPSQPPSSSNNTRPRCDVQVACSDRYQPVCASDNVTYENECHLWNAICRSGNTLRKEYDGECETFAPTPGPRGCRRCGGQQQRYRPVCGSDGRTYPSECELERAACLEQRDIVRRHSGACSKVPPIRGPHTRPPIVSQPAPQVLPAVAAVDRQRQQPEQQQQLLRQPEQQQVAQQQQQQQQQQQLAPPQAEEGDELNEEPLGQELD